MFNITSKLELNLLKGSAASDFDSVGAFLIKSRIPVVVVDPEFIEAMIIERVRCQGAFKIITAIDFDKGRNYAIDKFKLLPQSIFAADGYDVLLTDGRTEKECLNELRAVSEFVRSIDALKEIRWTLGLRTRSHEKMGLFLPHIRAWPASYIRTDSALVSPAATAEKHEDDIGFIKNELATPIKLCGNVTLDTINTFGINAGGVVHRFDVNMSQAKHIIHEIKEQERTVDDSKRR